MKKIVYQYAILRFMPFPQTEEFANIGIVIAAPEINWFGFMLEDKKRTKRVVDFFDLKNSKNLYRETISGISTELELMKDLVRSGVYRAEHAVERLALPKQTTIQASPLRVGIAKENPQKILNELFSKYVVVPNTAKKYREYQLEKDLKVILDGLSLPTPFRKEEIGDPGLYAYKFSLVRRYEGITQVIKPLYLGQDEPVKIIEHGDTLISRLHRLKTLNFFPDDFLVTYDLGGRGNEINADKNQKMVLDELRNFATLAEVGDKDKIKSFAQKVRFH